jgi:hypothetical protein
MFDQLEDTQENQEIAAKIVKNNAGVKKASKKLIQIIHNLLEIRFEGKTQNEAEIFISSNLKDAKRKKQFKYKMK